MLPLRGVLAEFLNGAAPDDEVVLLHNAAVIEPIGLVGTLHEEAVDDAVRVNLLAPMRLSNLFLAIGRRCKVRLRVVYVTSSAGHRPYPGWATYCATKVAAEPFMRCVALSNDPPCSVDIVDPGAMDTDMQGMLRERGAGLPGHEG
jgi:benzil reductase ((S)-benzoin forming)